VGANSITIGWPSGYKGWILQSQTNSLQTGLSSNWVDVLGSSTTTSMTFPLSKQSPSVFYRLRFP
jgi:hypothetical protein